MACGRAWSTRSRRSDTATYIALAIFLKEGVPCVLKIQDAKRDPCASRQRAKGLIDEGEGIRSLRAQAGKQTRD